MEGKQFYSTDQKFLMIYQMIEKSNLLLWVLHGNLIIYLIFNYTLIFCDIFMVFDILKMYLSFFYTNLPLITVLLYLLKEYIHHKYCL